MRYAKTDIESAIPKQVLSDDMINISPRLLCVLFVISAVTGAVFCKNCDAQDISINEIRRVWEDREERVQSAAFIWTQRKTMTKDLSAALSAAAGVEQAPPAEDLTTVSPDHRLYIEGSKISYHSVRLDLAVANHPDGFRRTKQAFDGEFGKTYLSARGELNHEGTIHSGRSYPDKGNINLFPVLVLVRALSEDGLNLKLEELQLDENQYEVDGIKCISLQGKPEASQDGFYRTFWVDPARDFVVVQYAEFYDDRESEPPRMWVKLDISYEQNAVVGWVPQEREYVFLATGGEAAGKKVMSSTHARVVSYELNRDIPEEEFSLTFPVGTIVRDRTLGTTWIQGEDDQRLPIESARAKKPGKNFSKKLIDKPSRKAQTAPIDPEAAPMLAVLQSLVAGSFCWFVASTFWACLWLVCRISMGRSSGWATLNYDRRFALLAFSLWPLGVIGCGDSKATGDLLRIENSPFHDFGATNQGEIQKHTFWLINDGADPVKVTRVKSSCSCVVADVSGIRNELIRPSARTALPVRFHVGTAQRLIRGQVVVFYHFQNTEGDVISSHSLSLHVQADIIPDYRIIPREIDFGEIDALADWPIRRSFNVLPGAMEKIVVLNLQPSHDWITATHHARGNGSGYDVTIDLDLSGHLLSTRLNGTVTITTNSTRIPKTLIPIRAKYRPPAEVTPSSVVIGSDERGTVPRTIEIKSNYPSVVSKYHVSESGVDIAQAELGQRGHAHSITLHIPQPVSEHLECQLEFELELFLNQGVKSVRTIHVPIYRFL